MNKINRIKELVEILNQYAYEYYTLDDPTVSDIAYDNLYDELSDLELETNIILSNSPTQRVGDEIKAELDKIIHKYPLKSLGKTKDKVQFLKFLKGKDGILMLKLDGLTNELVYRDGLLVESSTRGTGEIGESILHNVKTYNNIPLSIPCKEEVRIIGEAVIYYNDFDELNKDKKYKNPRNLVAGSVRQLDSSVCKRRKVSFLGYNVFDKDFDSKEEQLEWIKSQGFDIVPYEKLSSENNDLENSILSFREIAKEEYIPIDGLVLTFNDLKYAKTLSTTSHHPNHSLAFKYGDDVEITELIDVEWTIGRTGVVTPTAIFKPVDLDGSEVQRASVHNISIFKNLKLGYKDSISVYKANSIIPQIDSNLTQSGTIRIPNCCPSCNSELKIRSDSESEFLMCLNTNCKAQLIQNFSHATSRNCLNIDGLSEKTLEKFIDLDFIKTIPDIFRLEEYKSKITKLEGFGIKSYNNLIKSIDAAKVVKLPNFLFALGIPNCGLGTCKLICNYFNSDLNAIKGANLDSLMKIDGIGQITSKSIVEWFKSENNRHMLNDLLLYIEFEVEKVKETNNDGVFNNKKIYCTGSFASHKKEELKKIVEDNGGTFANGYAKSLDFLVIGSLKSSSKGDKAIKDGVKILQENEFLEMVK